VAKKYVHETAPPISIEKAVGWKQKQLFNGGNVKGNCFSLYIGVL
jgi:hypothetical protein